MVRDYLAGKVGWQAVHEYAIQLAYEDKAQFPPESPLQMLHKVFLTADADDDPQFRADRSEISALIATLDSLHRAQ